MKELCNYYKGNLPRRLLRCANNLFLEAARAHPGKATGFRDTGNRLVERSAALGVPPHKGGSPRIFP